MSRFLVTGAGGFIGSAVVNRLGKLGHDIVAPSSGDLDLLRCDEEQLKCFVKWSGAVHCIHCAWYTNHADYLAHEINRAWLAASLRLARSCRKIRFVALGTCLEYDLSRAQPCVEDITPLEPDTLYARCKRDLFGKLSKLDTDFVWARVFFVYGPGDRASRLIPRMIDCFSRDVPAGPIFGGLRRDYIHVDDLAGQIARIATAGVRGAINTGTGHAPTLSQIFEAGARAFGRPQLAQGNCETGGQPPLIQPSLTRFQSQVGNLGARDISAGFRALVK